MDYNDYVHPNQYLAQQSEDQTESQYMVIHSGGPGLSNEGFMIPTSSDNLMNDLGHGEQVGLSQLNVLEYCEEENVVKKERVEEEEEGEENEEEEEDDDDYQEDVDDILRNVMRVPGIQSVSPTPYDTGNSPPSLTQRRPLSEKQPHTSIASRPCNISTLIPPKPAIYANLPMGFSYKFAEKESDSIAGVIAQRVLGKGQWFGPYNGSLLNEKAGQVIGSTWELCLRGAVCFYLDGRNKIYNNWLYHINPARTIEEQNLEAFQHYGDIYFRALDTIQPGTELKVFYSEEYRVKIGCKMKLDDLDYDKDTDDFQCKECKARYKTSKSMLRHIKFTHDQEEGPAKPQLPEHGASSQHVGATNSTASDQLVQLAKRAQEESTSLKDAFQRSSKRTASQRTLIKRGDSGRLSGNTLSHGNASQRSLIKKDGNRTVLRNTLSHGSLRPPSSASRPQKQTTRTQSSTSRQDTVTKKSIVLPKRVANAAKSGDHVCPTCGKSFLNEGMLASHQLFHRTTITEFKCEVCGLVYKTFQECTRHRNNHAERLHDCILCENKYRYTGSYTRHLYNAHHVHRCRENYTCRLCGFLTGKTKMIAHRALCKSQTKDVEEEEWIREEAEAEGRSTAIKNRRQGGAFETEEHDNHGPDYQMENEEYGGWIDKDAEEVGSKEEEEESGSVKIASGTEDHDRASTSNLQKTKATQKFTCVQDEADKLGRHFGYFNKPRPFRCKHKSCHNSYVRRRNLLDHIRRCHIPENNQKQTHYNSRPYKCEQCPRTFSSEKAWNNHKVEHTDVKPFKCEPCSKWFRTSKLLQSHNYRMHTERDKKHKCAQCGKKFAEQYSLRYHERRHRGERNFQCEICERTFTTKYGLQCHMVIHTGEKHFACEICGKTFSLNLYLVRHALTHRSDNASKRPSDVDET